VKDPLNNMKRNRLSRYGGRKPIAVIVTEMAIREPLGGISIQSSTLKTRRQCMNKEEWLFNKKQHIKKVTCSH